jgi:hypothetical protein
MPAFLAKMRMISFSYITKAKIATMDKMSWVKLDFEDVMKTELNYQFTNTSLIKGKLLFSVVNSIPIISLNLFHFVFTMC